MRFHFPIIIIDEDFRSENASGLGIRALADAIEKEGGRAGRHQLRRPVLLRPAAEPGLAFILSIDDEELANRAEETIAELRLRRADPLQERRDPIFLHGETRTSRHIPNDILRELHGFIHVRGHA